MRKTIETAPRNGIFVILEDEAHGTFAVARWSRQGAQWLDDDGKPIQFNATHWQPPQGLDGEAAPARSGAPEQPPPVAPGGTTAMPHAATTPARPATGDNRVTRKRYNIVAMAACLLVGMASASLLYHSNAGLQLLHWMGSDNDSGLKQALEEERARAIRAARDVATAKEAADRSKEAGERALNGLREALQAEQSRAEKLAGQLAELQRDGAAQTARTRETMDDAAKERDRVVAELREALKAQDVQTTEARRMIEAETVQAKQTALSMTEALQQERAKVDELRLALETARRDTEAQTTNARSAGGEAARLKEANARATDALREAQGQTEKLTTELAAVRQEFQAQASQIASAKAQVAEFRTAAERSTDEQRQALLQERDKVDELRLALATMRRDAEAQAVTARSAGDEVTRLKEANARATDALRESVGRTEKLATELAAARQEVQAQTSQIASARAQAAGLKEAAERSADEQRQALLQQRDSTGKLTAELAEAKSELQILTKAKAADDIVRDNHLAALRGELQKARADAATIRDSLQTERSRAEQAEQLLVAAQAAAQGQAYRSQAPSAPAVARYSTTSLSTADTQTSTPIGDASHIPRSASRSEASTEEAGLHAVRLIARAHLLLDQGNIGAARNMLDRAAEMGSAEALFWLAETYDPLLLPARNALGTQGDITKARNLYERALVAGVGEARLRLKSLEK